MVTCWFCNKRGGVHEVQDSRGHWRFACTPCRDVLAAPTRGEPTP